MAMSQKEVDEIAMMVLEQVKKLSWQMLATGTPQTELDHEAAKDMTEYLMAKKRVNNQKVRQPPRG